MFEQQKLLNQQMKNWNKIVSTILLWGELLVFAMTGAEVITALTDGILQAMSSDNLDDVSILIMVFGITTSIIFLMLVIKVHNKVQSKYLQRLDYLIEKYQAQQIADRNEFLLLFNNLDVLSVAFNVKSPIVYLVDADKSKDISNCLMFENNGTLYLFITREMINQLSKYELEAVLVAEFASTTSGYNDLIISHYLRFEAVRAGAMWFVILVCFVTIESLVFIILAIPLLMLSVGLYFLSQWFTKKYADRINHHLQFLNTEVLKITNNPQMLIQAYSKIDASKKNFKYQVDAESFDNVLWLKPVLGNDYRWTLAKQIEVLKLF